MAGKFGSSAGEVIAEALVRARAEGTSRIGEQHLFAALLASPDEQAEVREARRRGGLVAGEESAGTGPGQRRRGVSRLTELGLRPTR